MSPGEPRGSLGAPSTVGDRPTIFISYRNEDTAPHARAIDSELTKHFGEECTFLDVDRREAGKWPDKIRRAIDRSDVLVAIIGRRWLGGEGGVSKVVRWELECALERGIDLIPVWVDGVAVLDPDSLPDSLKDLPEYDGVRLDHELYDASLGKVVAMVEQGVLAQRDRERMDRVEKRVATARAQVEAGDDDKARTTLESARAVAEEIEDDYDRRAALRLVAEVEEDHPTVALPAGELRDAELLARIRELAPRARAEADRAEVADARATLDAARDAANEIEADDARTQARSALAEAEAAIDWAEDAEREERLRELVRQAARQVEAGDAEAAQASVDSAEAALSEIRVADRRARVRGELMVVAQSLGAGPEAAERGDFVAAAAIAGPSGTTRRANSRATKEPGEPDHAGAQGGRSVWYRWTAPRDGAAAIDTFGSDFDTLLAVYRGSSVANLEPVAANDDAGGGRQSRVRFPVAAGDVYMIAVDGYGEAAGEIVLHWNLGDRTSNHTFDEAEELVGERGSAHGENSDAEKEPGEPDHAGNAGGRSVWYRWTASRDGIATIDTFDSDFDTLLAVYRGSSVANLEPVAANDDAGGGRQSQVSFPVLDGVEYMIAVDGFSGAIGEIVLNWGLRDSRSNDAFADALELVGEPGSLNGANSDTTKEPGEPDHAGNAGGRSVWYRWTAPRDGTATIDTFGSDFDTLLAVYRGSSVANLEPVAANDDAGGRTQSRVSFQVVDGAEYMIAVDGFGGATGVVVLNWALLDSLSALLRASGLRYREQGDETWTIPFGSPGSPDVEVTAAEVGGHLAIFTVPLPNPGFGGKAKSFQNMLRASFEADYVKAVSLGSGELAFRIEQRTAALNPSTTEGLIRSLAALGALRAQDLLDPSALTAGLASCSAAQAAGVQIRPDAEAVPDALRRAGHSVEQTPTGSHYLQLRIAGQSVPVRVVATDRAISFRCSLRVKPGADKKKLTRLLELNHDANVAKASLDNDQEVMLLFEVPRLHPGLMEELKTEFERLLAGVVALT